VFLSVPSTVIDFGQLFPKAERSKLGCDVFNGISVSETEDILYVTGKKWDRLFQVRLLA
jgi:glutamine cyclotransferase